MRKTPQLFILLAGLLLFGCEDDPQQNEGDDTSSTAADMTADGSEEDATTTTEDATETSEDATEDATSDATEDATTAEDATAEDATTDATTAEDAEEDVPPIERDITVTVYDGANAPSTSSAVVFLDASGAVLAEVTTDTAGRAVYTTTTDDLVSVAARLGESQRVFYFGEVPTGTSLRAGYRGGETLSAFQLEFEALPDIGTPGTWSVHMGCRSSYGASGIASPFSVSSGACSTSNGDVDVYAMQYDDAGALAATSFYAGGSAPDPGTLTMSSWSTSFDAIPVTLSGEAGAVDSAVALVHGWVDDLKVDVDFAELVLGEASEVSVPTDLDAAAVEYVTTGPGGTSTMWVGLADTSPVTQSFGVDFLLAPKNPAFDVPTATLTWESAGEQDINALRAEMYFSGGSLTVVLPPDAVATRFVLPTLPASIADGLPSGNTAVTTINMDYVDRGEDYQAYLETLGVPFSVAPGERVRNATNEEPF